MDMAMDIENGSLIYIYNYINMYIFILTLTLL